MPLYKGLRGDGPRTRGLARAPRFTAGVWFRLCRVGVKLGFPSGRTSPAEGLRRWPGTEMLFGDGEVHHVRQGINHVKVVVERGARTEAKAYVGMEVHPYGPMLHPGGG